jgi:hypothetical protein
MLSWHLISAFGVPDEYCFSGQAARLQELQALASGWV